MKKPAASRAAGEIARVTAANFRAINSPPAAANQAAVLNGADARPSLDLQNPGAVLASLPAPPNLKFEREDWSLFRTVEGLQQKAGVPKHMLARLVLKELADNGLDTGARSARRTAQGGGYFVEDDGPGIDGTPEEIARLFSHQPADGLDQAAAPADSVARSATACGSSPVPCSPPAARSPSSPAIAASCCAPSATAPRRW